MDTFCVSNDDDEYTKLGNELIQDRYYQKIAESFGKIVTHEHKKYFIQISPDSAPSELKNAILDFYLKIRLNSQKEIKSKEAPEEGDELAKSKPASLEINDVIKKALSWRCPSFAQKYFYNKNFTNKNSIKGVT